MAALELQRGYEAECLTTSDINEHLPVLRKYAGRCDSVLELGVRSCVSSWAFLMGLHDATAAPEALDAAAAGPKRLVSVDLDRDDANVARVRTAAEEAGISHSFVQKNDLDLDATEFGEEVDLTFIDTWHVYGHLKRELLKFAPVTRKFIIMHDTEVDRTSGESLRCGWDTAAQARLTGIPEDEIRRGLEPAILEFLAANPEWTTLECLTNCNGLTVLARRDQR